METGFFPYPLTAHRSTAKLVPVRRWREIIWDIPLTILCIACFPANPLVLTGLIDIQMYMPLIILGGIVWVFGMVLVMAPIIVFPKRGGVARGKSYVHTTRLVDTGIYSVVRHPQYTGGVYSIFITTLLWYPHWLFAVLGVIGIVLLYFGTKAEDKFLIEKFGNDYRSYMGRVPGMNIFAGISRRIRSKKE